MKPLAASNISTLKAYVPGKPISELERELGITGSIKLASNENPLGPSPLAMEAVRQHIAEMHIYPDGAAFALRDTLAAFHGIDPVEITTGNGSNELLTLAVRTFCSAGVDHAMISDCSFVAYRIILQAQNVATTIVPMKDDLVHDLDAMLAAIRPETKMIFVANPNNPTGTYVNSQRLRAFLRAVRDDIVVVVDEAYHEYVTADDYESAEKMRGERERLLICRSFSKCYGLGGLRAGYAIGTAEMIDLINRVREPFNCSALAQVGAAAAIGDADFVARSLAMNIEGRALMEERLRAMAYLGVSWIPSQTNFLLVRTPHEGKKVYDLLLQRGVIVRPLGPGPLVNDLRITIGTAAQVQRCCDALLDVLTELTELEA